MLHDGLGSIPQWRSLPAQVAEQSGRTVLAYERAGHGESLPTPTGPWPTDWLRDETAVLAEVIAQTTDQPPVVVGMSDGGSIALLHAMQPDCAVSAVLTLAAHSWVEQVCFEAIVAMRANRTPIVTGLSRFHRDAAAVFDAWSGAWVSDEFRVWDIRSELSTIDVPTLVAQGAEDAYATQAHAHITADAIGANAASLIVPDVGHIMHHDDSDGVARLVTDFLHQHH